jgi:hypothetical protein
MVEWFKHYDSEGNEKRTRHRGRSVQFRLFQQAVVLYSAVEDSVQRKINRD